MFIRAAQSESVARPGGPVFLVLFALTAFGCGNLQASIMTFINEFHYDNTGGDVGEFIEIAGVAGTDLTGWTLLLYNGAGGAVYSGGTISLSGVISNQSNGFGTLSFAAVGLQNGAPDGIALVNNSSTVLEFLSYEGTFTAVGGAANGMLSTDVGVSELGTEPIGRSLQRTGTGNMANNFSFVGPLAGSAGQVNAGQTFQGGAVPEPGSFVAWAFLGFCAFNFRSQRHRIK